MFWFCFLVFIAVTTKRRSASLGGEGEESAELLLVTHTEGGVVEVMVSRRVIVHKMKTNVHEEWFL